VSLLVLLIILALGRWLFLAITFFLSTDILLWREMLFPWERRLLRFLAELGMSDEEKAKVQKMRDRINRGEPPF
jgi:hypothetical protein